MSFSGDSHGCHVNRPYLIITVSKQTKDVSDGAVMVMSAFEHALAMDEQILFLSLSLFALVQPVTLLFL